MYRIASPHDADDAEADDADKVHKQQWLDEVNEEAQAAATIVGDVAERLRRLGTAYGEWKHFDAPAYFDIPQPQADLLLTVVERVSSVYVHFQMDLLLPSFSAAESYWANHFAPAYHAANIAHLGRDELVDGWEIGPRSTHRTNGNHVGKSLNGADVALLPSSNKNAFVHDFFAEVRPAMLSHWQRLMAVIQAARRILVDDIGYLTTNGGEDERNRYYQHWQSEPAPGLPAELCPALEDIPTLSLTFTFPLPVHRQSGRLRRLRTNRERNRRRKGRDKN